MSRDDVELAQRLQRAFADTRAEVARRIVGQEDIVSQLMVAILMRGHCLLEGVPGLGKTRTVQALADAMRMKFQRVQFTPDLMPSDITGSEVLEPDHEQRLQHKTVFGPVFTNVLLADEINRTPPKTQAALLEAMSERQVTIGNQTHTLAPPFFVLATQNPVEQEGTYPLPEAQLDRFAFKLQLEYPGEDEEIDIIRISLNEEDSPITPQMTAAEVLAYQQLVKRVPVPEPVMRFAARLVRSTRAGSPGAVPGSQEIEWGAGPRASIYLTHAAQARALLRGGFHATVEDLVECARPVLRHRILLRFESIAEGRTPDDVIADLLAHTQAA